MSFGNNMMTGLKGRHLSLAGGRTLSPRRVMKLTLAALIVVAAASVFGLVQNLRRHGWNEQMLLWFCCGCLVSLTIVMIYMGKYMLRRSLASMETALREHLRSERGAFNIESLPEEWRPMMIVLNDYAQGVRDRFDHLRIECQELKLQSGFAESEHRHVTAVMDSIHDAVLVVDAYGDLLMANRAAEKMFGFSANLCRRGPVERALEDPWLVGRIKDARHPMSGDEARSFEYENESGGTLRIFTVTLSRVTDSSGRLNGVAAVFHDMTRERELARMKADFVSAVSHELRTPLCSIRAYIEMLIEGEAPDAETEQSFMRIIDGEAGRLQRLIENILNISRIESGVMQVELQPTDPDATIRRALEVITPQAGDKDILLNYMPAGPAASLPADSDMFYQAVLNLIGNAVKYTPRGGCVRITADTDERTGQYVISVADSGIGIAEEELDRVFDKFYRSRQASHAARGTGLGLNLVKQIVETVHNGQIAVASEPGRGATFTIRLPLLPQEAGECQHAA